MAKLLNINGDGLEKKLDSKYITLIITCKDIVKEVSFDKEHFTVTNVSDTVIEIVINDTTEEFSRFTGKKSYFKNDCSTEVRLIKG